MAVCPHQPASQNSLEEFFLQCRELDIPLSDFRKRELLSEKEKNGWAKFNEVELRAAGQLAWKNAERCIGRLPWNTLTVVDAQEAITARAIFDKCIEHIVWSTNAGKVRPLMTFFRPQTEQFSITIHNDQLIRYAGYRIGEDEVLGDPAQVKMTELAIALGWQPPVERSPFDVLPLMIETSAEEVQFFDIPAEVVLEIPIEHHTYAWFSGLQLKWHALPAVSNVPVDVAGQRYSAAPFSGYYMATEIGVRNFGDERRYNLTELVAGKLGLDVTQRDRLWKDRALVELTSAVLHSYRKNGVSIIDHHSASRQFLRFVESEETRGKKVPADWSWIVPPLSGSACPVFHRYYDETTQFPRFLTEGS